MTTNLRPNMLAHLLSIGVAGSTGSGFKAHTMRVVTSSKKHKWRSDPKLIRLIEEFARGRIGLDPCASKLERFHFADVNYSLHNGLDGLVAPWVGFGVAYANPEYKRPLSTKFVRKAVDEFVAGVVRDRLGRPILTQSDPKLRCGRGDHLFLLLPARPDTKMFQQELLPFVTAMCFWRGRLKFSGSDPAPFPSLILYFGYEPKRFRRLFEKHGWVPG